MYFNEKSDTDINSSISKSKHKKNNINLKDIFNKYKIYFILAIILIISLILIFANNTEYYIDLNGEEYIKIYEGSEYIEDANGYYAYDSKGNDLTSEVEVTNNIDNNTIGEYTITYKLHNVTKERYISVIEKPNIATYIHLKGDEVIYLSINEEYIDPGYTAIDTVDSNLTKKVKVTNNIDNTKAGIYKVTYSVTNSSGVTSSAVRKVIVMDSEVSLSLSNTNPTNSSVSINIHITDNYYSYLILPNGEKITSKDYSYKVNSNGEYKFTIYNTKGKSVTKSISVTNIDKEAPTGSCSGYTEDGKSYITVNATDNVGISYYISNGVTNNGNIITLESEVSTPTVTIYDKAGNSKNITCTLEKRETKSKQLEIHFIGQSGCGTYDDAILIRTDDKTILIDGGLYSCRKRVTPYLQDLGVTKIDMMIGSHLHNNHIQAQADILENFTVDRVIYPDDIFNCLKAGSCNSNDQKYIVDALKKYNKTPEIIRPGNKITLGEMELYFLAPETIVTTGKYPENSNSFIFILKYYNNTFMFTGDMPTPKTEAISKYAEALNISLDVDVLKYPHHGNNTLTDSFLDAIKPEYVIVPNQNKPDYPNSANTQRLKNHNTKIYKITDSSTGNIVVLSDGNTITVKNNEVATNYKR